MKKEHLIIQNEIALTDYGCEIISNLKDECNNKTEIVHMITYPIHLMN